jgi:hypothetical protein
MVEVDSGNGENFNESHEENVETTRSGVWFYVLRDGIRSRFYSGKANCA